MDRTSGKPWETRWEPEENNCRNPQSGSGEKSCDLYLYLNQRPVRAINIKKPKDLVKKPKLLENFLVFLPKTLKIIRKSTKNMEKPTKTERGDPGGPKGPQPSLFWLVFPCFLLIFLWFLRFLVKKTKSSQAVLVFLPSLLVSLCLWFLLGAET